MIRLRALETLAEVRGNARLWIAFVPDQGDGGKSEPLMYGENGEPLFWQMRHRPTRADVEALDRKLAGISVIRVLAHKGFTGMGFTLNTSADGRVEKIGDLWHEAD
jgi:hypothetical protein